jgi:hypothetical protein
MSKPAKVLAGRYLIQYPFQQADLFLTKDTVLNRPVA